MALTIPAHHNTCVSLTPEKSDIQSVDLTTNLLQAITQVSDILGFCESPAATYWSMPLTCTELAPPPPHRPPELEHHPVRAVLPALPLAERPVGDQRVAAPGGQAVLAGGWTGSPHLRAARGQAEAAFRHSAALIDLH